MMEKLEVIIEWLKRRVNQEEFKEFLVELLLKLCSINTIPNKDLKKTAENEALTFQIIIDSIHAFGLPGEVEAYPISPLIRDHPSYTLPYYTDEVEAYEGRFNLVFLWDSSQRSVLGRKIAVNAHIDTVSPYVDVFRKGDKIFGRGTCDDKSGCVLMISALRLLRNIKERFNVVPGNDLTFMFVIDEETGGNGSLSLALDRNLKKHYDVLVVLECCEQQMHPANRGAVWYKIEVSQQKVSQPIILAMEIIHEIEKEGASIREESDHPLFPQRPVQTCHGILGPFGEHPSRICGYVALVLKKCKSYKSLTRSAEAGLASYIKKYGDKRKIIDSETGTAVIKKHYEVERQGNQYVLRVWGSTGHMASINENDNAITKASFMIREIVKENSEVNICFEDGRVPDPLLIEGGQGFVPTHSIDQIKRRLNEAMIRGADRYAVQREKDSQRPAMTFEKLHNNAFDGDPSSLSMKDAIKCSELLGIPLRKPIVGFDASCDARLFADVYPEMEIITTGPGKLKNAHSDSEQISISELAQSCAVLTLFLLVHTESLKIENPAP